MRINDIETPALILDKNILQQNIDEMDRLLRGSSLSLRPHYKSHKCSALAHLQIEHGAIGMTCAKLSEAVDLCDSGIENILIANQIVEPQKLRKLADLAAKCTLTVCVDNFDNVDALNEAAMAADSSIGCLIEFEIGMQRCGVCKNEEVLALAKHILTKSNLTFEGIQAYAGHISHMADETERRELTKANHDKIKALLSYLGDNGIGVKTLSGGSTGTGSIKAADGLYTELQAGSYLFMDSTYATLGLPFKNSLFVLATVVSAKDGLTVVDSGVKTCGVDQGMPLPCGFEVSKIVDSEEHFQLHNPSVSHKIGDKIRLIPAHCCSTVNLHDRIYVVDGDRVVDRLLITARGMGK